ncbi:uncharacterized protein LOC123698718 [Colias croceus]|uniref:uncharacterized protein LOC123698718 n=1 Tax=Colias crocea TaxID=72248 RepID=UPI001E27FAF6|nr:uncharacterized protein LOC123698718 [Colias croceus]
MEAHMSIQYDLFEKLKKAELNFRKSPKERIKPSYIETRLENLEDLWREFKAGHRKIIASISAAEKSKTKYFSDDLYEEFEEFYTTFKCVLKDACATVPKSNNNIPSVTKEEVKLPTIQLQTFSGKYEDWQAFHDMHISIVQNNASLSNVEKFHYLKSSLTGEAATYLNNYATTDQNYLEAWKQLVKRYDNKKYNVNTVMKRLFSQKKITHEISTGLKSLIDTTSSCLTSLYNMKIKTDNWDTFIVYFVVTRLDAETHRLWENHDSQLNPEELATWTQLLSFLETRFRTLEKFEAVKHTPKSQQATPVVKHKSFHSSIQRKESVDNICALCEGPHFIYSCKSFLQQPVNARQSTVENKRLCFNCLSSTHTVKKCRHSTCCKKCGRRHHSLLHRERDNAQENLTHNQHSQNQDRSSPSNSSTETKISAHFSKVNPVPLSTEIHVSAHTTRDSSHDVVLATAIIKAYSRNGVKHIVRALLDQGSQASFISEKTVQLLGLPRIPINGLVSGLGEGLARSKYLVSLFIESYHNPSTTIQVNAHVLSSLTTHIPSHRLHTPSWPDVHNLTLADPSYNIPGKIDVLLGADIYSEILLNGVLKNSQGLVAQETTLGWILSGKLPQSSERLTNRSITMHVQERSDELLKKFFEMEAEPDSIERKLSPSEIKCEELYDATTTRNSDGRFVVKLPFTSDDPQCMYGNSKDIAVRKLKALERRLKQNLELYEDYRKVLREYLELNHMIEIEETDIDNPKAVYLPHHAVVRKEKDTTKVRVVFNASSKGVNDVSLNDDLHIGPKLQQDLRHLLMRWRTHRVCIIGDLVKMYRQILVKDEDTNYQRIVWRNDSNQPIKHYKLLTLTFGTACAPYLAVKTLQTLAKQEQLRFPTASEITQRDFYIDDLMTGCENLDEALHIYDEINSLMKSGGFQMQKWSSNDTNFLSKIGKDKMSDDFVRIKSDNQFKVLGLSWNRETDNFEYTINLPDGQHPVTKRQILSDIARLYDPIGWIAPVVVKAKIYIQKVWKAGLDWDANLTEDLLIEWNNFRKELNDLKNIVIPRWLHTSKDTDMELHAFSDASKAAYAAAIYLRVVNKLDKSVHVTLITAKTKVAPIDKEISIPRLELCGATLAAKLVSEVAQVMGIVKENTYAWTDSTVVLAWLKGPSSRWATFVSNRVSTILTILDYNQWGHVPSESNPADCASRGLKSTELKNYSLWWKGPDWLCNSTIDIDQPIIPDTEEERNTKSFCVQHQKKEDFEWVRFSSLFKMLRVMAWCRRIFNRGKAKLPKYLTSNELNEALFMCIKQVQHHEFAEDIKHLSSKGYVIKKSVLHKLTPFLDEKGIVRVGGRIKQHPIIIPGRSHLATLIISDTHSRTLHGGPQLMLNIIRAKYWILRARDRVKKFYRSCITCLRHSKAQKTQIMGELPDVRLNPSKPFRSTGVDYAGPILMRFSPGRGSKAYKGYICIFVCMVTRAIHLEAVSDLSAKGFIAAFRRFTSRRGHCQDLYSDNATNFVGADKLLQSMLREARKENPNELVDLLSYESTTWHYIPPYSPNFGGLWEAGVRCVKTHLRKVIGDSTLTYEELTTVLHQIEACLNSRPITLLNNNPDDPLPLTPGHFLVGEPLINIPDENHLVQNISHLERWKTVQKMVNEFWTRWSKEYLVTMAHRQKWTTKTPEPNIGDIVVLRDEQLPPCKWALGKIVDKHPGPDKITRVVTVKCKNGLFKRALSKVCVLPK